MSAPDPGVAPPNLVTTTADEWQPLLALADAYPWAVRAEALQDAWRLGRTSGTADPGRAG
jgi:hypothetical protein